MENCDNVQYSALFQFYRGSICITGVAISRSSGFSTFERFCCSFRIHRIATIFNILPCLRVGWIGRHHAKLPKMLTFARSQSCIELLMMLLGR